MKKIMLGLVVLALAGCSTTPPPITLDQKLTGKEGAVVLKLITNGSGVNDPAETLSSINLKREVPPNTPAAAGDSVTLLRTRVVTQSTAVFSGMVAPGRYRVLNAVGYAGNTTYTFPLAARLGSFDVKEGEVSLLGTLLIQPTQGNSFVVGHVAPEAELTDTFEQLFPALAEQTRGKPVNTFNFSLDLNDSAKRAPLFKRMTSALNGLKLLNDGSFVAGSKVGSVLWRKAGERRWRGLNVDSWKEVLSVRAYRGGLLAAGEEGLLRYTADEGKTWRTLTPPERGVIAAAEPMPNGKVIALVRKDANWTAYASDDLLAGSWRKLGAFPHERSINLPNQSAVTVATGNRVGVMMPNGEFLAVDSETGALERGSTGSTLVSVHATPGGMLVMQGTTLTRTTLVSTDGGRKWTDLNTSRFITAITFADSSTAYAVAPIDPGMFAGEYALMISRDSGKTWAKSGVTPGGRPAEVRSLMVDPSDDALFAFLRNGNILRSADQGATWVREL